VGARAPEFRLPRADGGEIGLAEITVQGPALLAFFKISCPVCQLTFPFLERIHQASEVPAPIGGVCCEAGRSELRSDSGQAKARPTSDEALTQQLSASCKTGALAVYGISQNDAADTRDFAERYWTTFPMLLDSEKTGYAVSNAYGISSVPTIFVIGNDSVIQQVIMGWRKREMTALGAIRPDDSVPEWKAG
jgi:peroxiredoxin